MLFIQSPMSTPMVLNFLSFDVHSLCVFIAIEVGLSTLSDCIFLSTSAC
jgi:hypothetical protein